MSRSVAERYFSSRFSDFLGRLIDALEQSAVLRYTSRLGKVSILDAPCGMGRFFEVFLASSLEVTGADISKSMILIARERARVYGMSVRPNLVVCEIEHLPLRERVFECVVCIRLIGLVPPKARGPIIRELCRVSNRYIVFSFHNWLTLMGILGKLRAHARRSKDEWYPQTLVSVKAELKSYGLNRITFRSVLPFLSETCMVLAEKPTRHASVSISAL